MNDDDLRAQLMAMFMMQTALLYAAIEAAVPDLTRRRAVFDAAAADLRSAQKTLPPVNRPTAALALAQLEALRRQRLHS